MKERKKKWQRRQTEKEQLTAQKENQENVVDSLNPNRMFKEGSVL